MVGKSPERLQIVITREIRHGKYLKLRASIRVLDESKPHGHSYRPPAVIILILPHTFRASLWELSMVYRGSLKARLTTAGTFSVERMREVMGIDDRLSKRLKRSPEQFAQARNTCLGRVRGG